MTSVNLGQEVAKVRIINYLHLIGAFTLDKHLYTVPPMSLADTIVS